MKNSIIIVTLLLCFQILSAQQNKFDIGLLAGPNFNKLAGNDVVRKNSKSVTFWAAGLHLQYNFPKILSITTGVFIEKKGSGTNVTLTDATGKPLSQFKWRLRLDYLVIPLMAKVSFGSKIKIFAAAGGYFGHFLNSVEGYSESEKFATQNNLLYAKQDFGALANLGVALPLGKRLALSLEGRYAHGLANISALSGELNTRSLSVLLGLNFKLGSRSK